MPHLPTAVSKGVLEEDSSQESETKESVTASAQVGGAE
jgi:hypothetical protein